MRDFEIAYAAAVDALPNANILNMISKAKQTPYKQLVLEMFKTEEKIRFRYDAGGPIQPTVRVARNQPDLFCGHD